MPILALEAVLCYLVLTMCISYIKQIRNTGISMWAAQPNNWLDAMTVVLQATILVVHVGG